MAVPRLETARKDYDLETCSPRHKTLDSTKNQFKVHMQGSGTVTMVAAGGGGSSQRQSVDLTHNLGYQPTFFAWAGGPEEIWKQNPVMNVGATGPLKWCTGMTRLNENTIRFYIYIWDPFLAAYDSFDVNYEYIIFVEPNKDAWS